MRALLSQAEAEGCLARLAEAAAVVGDGRRAAVEAVYDELETGLVLLGSTAVEDLLQVVMPARHPCCVNYDSSARAHCCRRTLRRRWRRCDGRAS